METNEALLDKFKRFYVDQSNPRTTLVFIDQSVNFDLYTEVVPSYCLLDETFRCFALFIGKGIALENEIDADDSAS